MKSFPLRMVLAGAVLMGGLSGLGCREEGPAERAGRSIDNAAEDLREGSQEAAEEIRDEVDDAAEETREAAEELGDKLDDKR